LGKIYFARDIWEPEIPPEPKPLSKRKLRKLEELAMKPLHQPVEECTHPVKSWGHISDTLEAMICCNCLATFEIRTRRDI